MRYEEEEDTGQVEKLGCAQSHGTVPRTSSEAWDRGVEGAVFCIHFSIVLLAMANRNYVCN